MTTLSRKAINTARVAARRDRLVVNWATEGRISVNWGDKLNPYFGRVLSGLEVVHRADVIPHPQMDVHFLVGSNLATACREPETAVVWGSGFITATVPIEGCPRELHAVRGWLSAERLAQAGFPPPDVVGDPALILPLLHRPRKLPRRYGLGVIPHFLEYFEPFFLKARTWEDTLLIDITGGVEEVIDQINACDRIASSSLHGIICADAYEIPSLWLRTPSDRVGGDGFKFRDYFSSVARPDLQPFLVDATTTREALLDAIPSYRIQHDLAALVRACPIATGAVRARLLSRISD